MMIFDILRRLTSLTAMTILIHQSIDYLTLLIFTKDSLDHNNINKTWSGLIMPYVYLTVTMLLLITYDQSDEKIKQIMFILRANTLVRNICFMNNLYMYNSYFDRMSSRKKQRY